MKRFSRSVATVGERELLDRYLPLLRRGAGREVPVPPGDDAAVVRGNAADWVVTTDMLVEDVHFRREWTSGADLGHKALAVNLSDLAAMGDVVPSFGVVSLGLPPSTPVGFVDDFYAGMSALARRHRFRIVGGDTVRSRRLTVSVTALGRVSRGARPVLRGGARPGDEILVTGTVGDAAAGLQILERRPRDRSTYAPLVRSFLRPFPRLDVCSRIGRTPGVTALMDSSDGFYRSVAEICRASGVGARVEAEAIPLSRAFRAWARSAGKNPLTVALSGGEDYQLVLTARPAAARELAREHVAGIVGRVLPAREKFMVYEKGKPRTVTGLYEHFA
jgi:thiamine-monophosphate kinase